MSVQLAGRLLRSGLVPEADVQAALHAVVMRGVPFIVALSDRGDDIARILDRELSRLDTPVVNSPRPVGSLMESLPQGMCERLLAVPVRLDARAGLVEVAAVDPKDPQVVEEFAHKLETAVRVVRTPLRALLATFGEVERGRRSVPPPPVAPASGEGDALGLPPPARLPADLDPSTPNPPPSAPPLPLVTRSVAPVAPIAPADEPPQFERHRTSPGFEAPQKETFGQDESGEPVLGLYRSKAPPPIDAPEEHTAAPSLGIDELAPYLERLEHTMTPDAITDVLIEALSHAGVKAAVFAVRGGAFQGRSCNDAVGALSRVRAISVPVSETSVFETSVQAGYYLGAIPHTASHDALREVFNVGDDEVYLTPSLVSGHPVLVLFVTGFRDSATTTRWVDQLAGQAAEALGRILRGRKSK